MKTRITTSWNNAVIWKHKKINKQNKKRWKKILSLEVPELFLVQCNLVDNQYQQKSGGLYTFTPNKSYTYLLNVEPSNLVFLKTYDTQFDEITRTFTDQNDKPLGIEEKVNLTLLSNK